MKNFIYFLFISLLMTGCSVDSLETIEDQNQFDLQMNAKKGNPHDSFGVPEISEGESGDNSIRVDITATENGATGGLSVRWMTLEDYNANGWSNDMAGHVLLNGNANDAYSLGQGETFEFFLEDYISGEGDSWNRALDCDMSYLFIVRAHQDGKMQKSDYSEPVSVSTAACEPEEWCTFDEDEYSITLENSYVDESLDDVGAVRNFLINEFSKIEEEAPTDGSFDKTNLELLQEYNRQRTTAVNNDEWPIIITTTYTAGEGECEDTADLTITITESEEE